MSPRLSDDPLYALLVRATAGEGCEYELGTMRDVLVVAQGDSEDIAQEQALRALSMHGWIIAEVRRQAPVALDVSSEPGYLGQAVRDAAVNGFQIIVYDK